MDPVQCRVGETAVYWPMLGDNVRKILELPDVIGVETPPYVAEPLRIKYSHVIDPQHTHDLSISAFRYAVETPGVLPENPPPAIVICWPDADSILTTALLCALRPVAPDPGLVDMVDRMDCYRTEPGRIGNPSLEYNHARVRRTWSRPWQSDSITRPLPRWAGNNSLSRVQQRWALVAWGLNVICTEIVTNYDLAEALSLGTQLMNVTAVDAAFYVDPYVNRCVRRGELESGALYDAMKRAGVSRNGYSSPADKARPEMLGENIAVLRVFGSQARFAAEIGYEFAPVVLVINEDYYEADGTGKELTEHATVMSWPTETGVFDHVAFRREMGEGWGGGPTITGSPLWRGYKLDEARLFSAARKAVRK